MNLAPSRVGVLFSPSTPIWTGTISAYVGADTFRLTVATVTGSLADLSAGLAVYTSDGRLVRIKSVNAGSNYIYVAENSLSTVAGGGFVLGTTLSVYNLRLPFPKYQRVMTNVATVTGDAYSLITDLKLFSETTLDSTYWWDVYANSGNWHLQIYNDSTRDPETLVARSTVIPSTGSGWRYSIKEKNDSGLSGGVTLTFSGASPTADDGTITVAAYQVRKDYDITWASLGANDAARNNAEQGPIAIVYPETAKLDLNEVATFDASGSFATYYGADHRAPNPDDPATIPAGGYEWVLGTGGVFDSGEDTSVITCHFTTAGFRYISLTVTDDNSVSQVRYIPVWVGMTPETNFLSGSMSFEIGTSYRARLTMYMPTEPFRYALVLLVDLDNDAPLFLGWIWPHEAEYDFEKRIASFEVWPTLAFLQNVSARPFELYGQKGDAQSWDYFDMLSVPRIAYFLLRWHSTALELCNFKFNVVTASVPTAAAADTPLQYIRDVTAGSIGEQLSVMAASPFLALYGHALGDIEAVLDPIYAADITTPYDTQTLDLTLPNVAVKVRHTLTTPTVNEARLGGWYYDGSNYYPIVVQSPTRPGNWGKPKDDQNFVVSTVSELVTRAGRYIGAENYGDIYGFRCLSHIDLKTYKLVDYPADLFTSATRMIIRKLDLTFDVSKSLWVETLEAKTFGLTELAGQEQETGMDPSPPPESPSTPVTPTNLIATAISNTQIELDWSASGDSHTFIQIWRSPDGTTYANIATVPVTETTYYDSGLSPATPYWYKVIAFNNITFLFSSFSNVATATTTNFTDPTNLFAIAIDATHVTIDWSSTSTGVTAFCVERGTDGVGFAQIATTDDLVMTYADSGLTTDVAYYYRVRATNGVGAFSGYSNVSSATPSGFLAPILSTNNSTTTTVDLIWDDRTSDEEHFEIQRKQTGSWATVQTTLADVVTWQDTLLTPTNLYYYRARATKTGVNSAWSNTVAVVTMNSPTVLTATAISTTAIDLGWTDNSANETGFQIERGLSEWGYFTIIDTVGVGVVVYHDTGLTPDTTYYYRVCATHALGNSGYSNVAHAITTLLLAPSGLTASAVSNIEIDLSWTNNEGTATLNLIERSPDGITFAQIDSVDGGDATYNDTTCIANTQYWYQVRCTDGVTHSDYSNVADATTEPTFPVTGILDTFSGGDQGPPPDADWVTPAARDGCVTKDGQMQPDPAGGLDGGAVWNHGIGAYSEVYATTAHVQDMTGVVGTVDVLLLACNLANHDPLADNGYYLRVYYTAGSGFSVQLCDDVSSCGVESSYFTLGEGDEIGFSYRDDGYLRAYRRPSGGSWVMILKQATFDVHGAGDLGVWIYRVQIGAPFFSCVYLDNFGGGTIP